MWRADFQTMYPYLIPTSLLFMPEQIHLKQACLDLDIPTRDDQMIDNNWSGYVNIGREDECMSILDLAVASIVR